MSSTPVDYTSANCEINSAPVLQDSRSGVNMPHRPDNLDDADLKSLQTIQLAAPNGEQVNAKEGEEEESGSVTSGDSSSCATDSPPSPENLLSPRPSPAQPSSAVVDSEASLPGSPSSVQPSPRKGAQVANLKQFYEAIAAENRIAKASSHKPVIPSVATSAAPVQREHKPELLSLSQKKDMFEQKIRETKRWSFEIAEAKNATKKF